MCVCFRVFACSSRVCPLVFQRLKRSRMFLAMPGTDSTDSWRSWLKMVSNNHKHSNSCNLKIHRDRSQCAVWVIDVVSEELVLGLTKAAAGSWEEDYDRLLLPVLDKELPCYILFRLDSTNSLGHEWIFIAWSPDHSPVRDHYEWRSWCFVTGSSDQCFGSLKQQNWRTWKGSPVIFRRFSYDWTFLPTFSYVFRHDGDDKLMSVCRADKHWSGTCFTYLGLHADPSSYNGNSQTDLKPDVETDFCYYFVLFLVLFIYLIYYYKSYF